jgi:hypothetical protein
MLHWISEPSTSTYMLFAAMAAIGLLAGVFFGGFSRKRDQKRDSSPLGRIGAIAGVIGVLLFVGLYVGDSVYESDREQIVRKMNEMSAGVQSRNLNAVFANISESFRKGGTSKAALRSLADKAQMSHQVDEVVIWGIEMDRVPKDSKPVDVDFLFKVKGSLSSGEFFRGKATFVRDADGQWRMQTFDVFNPAAESRTPIAIPGL